MDVAACLSIDTLLSLVQGLLDPAAAATAHAHLLSCLSCEQLAGELAAERAPSLHVFGPGDVVSRYVVERRIGGGEMGIVYEASDPTLERRVALKLVRAEEADKEGLDQLSDRLLREGQAMAKLSHPNVMTVYDVGKVGDQVFIAMELIVGLTLREWQREAHSVDAILSVYGQAGLGLAAAHRAGIVHRDFKPENVLVASDGRTIVTDFGLAGGLAKEKNPQVGSEPQYERVTDLTRTGFALGTPAYMAPEQLRGAVADARSDVFAFSVALYEALFAVRPFAATTLRELASTIEQGLAPRNDARVPRWLERTLRVGLSAKAEDRYPSMDALLGALDSRARAARIKWRVATLCAAVILVATVWLALKPECTDAEAAWGNVWTSADQTRIQAAFAASGKANAYALVARSIEAAHLGWVTMHRDACLQRRSDPAGVPEQRSSCLDERKRELSRVIALLGEPDNANVDPSAIWRMSRLDDCANAHTLALWKMRATNEATADLVEARALYVAGRYEQGLRVSTEAVARARAQGDVRSLALLLIELGAEQQEQFAFSQAEASYHEAARLAFLLHDDAVAADAWTKLVGVVGYRMERPAEAHILAGYAEVAIENVGNDHYRRALLESRIAQVEWWSESKLESAYARYEEARLLASPFSQLEMPMFAARVHTGVLHDMGRDDLSLGPCEDAMFAIEAVYGRDHVEYYYYAANYAESLILNGGAKDAADLLEDLLRRFSALPEGYAAHLLAQARRELGDPSSALKADILALQLLAADLDSLDAAFAWTGLGLDLLMLGRKNDAREPLERAARIRQNAKLATLRAETHAALARALPPGGEATALTQSAQAAFRAAADRFGSALFRQQADKLAHAKARQ